MFIVRHTSRKTGLRYKCFVKAEDLHAYLRIFAYNPDAELHSVVKDA